MSKNNFLCHNQEFKLGNFNKEFSYDGVKDEKLWGSLKDPTFREGSRKIIIEVGFLKKVTWTVCRFKGGELGKNERVVFFWGGGGDVDTPMHTMTIWRVFLNKIE